MKWETHKYKYILYKLNEDKMVKTHLFMKLTIVDKNYCQKEEINFLRKGVFFNEYF